MITSVSADVASATVSSDMVHVELAQSMPDGSYVATLRLELPIKAAAEISALLQAAVERARALAWNNPP